MSQSTAEPASQSKKATAQDAEQVTSPWFVYILRCADNTLYTGVTTDIHRREKEHNSRSKSAAKYTRARQPVSLIYHENSLSRSLACKRESQIKKLTRRQKEALIETA
jgi:putative endonuclease